MSGISVILQQIKIWNYKCNIAFKNLFLDDNEKNFTGGYFTYPPLKTFLF